MNPPYRVRPRSVHSGNNSRGAALSGHRATADRNETRVRPGAGGAGARAGIRMLGADRRERSWSTPRYA
ncbi:hypothetical protein FMEAI12_3220017 [Parafrankia sp. Ea1.12]|nr:hypothetical protein FMEAI12_3220017 [Parafrankia sp. Ea1.12]